MTSPSGLEALDLAAAGAPGGSDIAVGAAAIRPQAAPAGADPARA